MTRFVSKGFIICYYNSRVIFKIDLKCNVAVYDRFRSSYYYVYSHISLYVGNDLRETVDGGDSAC